MSPEDIEWLRERLHADHCRQCDLVRELLGQRQ